MSRYPVTNKITDMAATVAFIVEEKERRLANIPLSSTKATAYKEQNNAIYYAVRTARDLAVALTSLD